MSVAGEVQGQDGHEHAAAERGSHREADQHDQHSLAVSLGMGQEGQEGPGPPSTPPWLQSPLCSAKLQVSPSSQALGSDPGF